MFKNNDNYNKIETKYVGYIEFLGIKVELVNGINKNNLDAHHACLEDINTLLNNNDTTIIAGHSIDDVFNKLHQMKIGDYINIEIANKEFIYKVNKIEIVDKDSITPLNDNVDLILITCMVNPNKRLIIKANT